MLAIESCPEGTLEKGLHPPQEFCIQQAWIRAAFLTSSLLAQESNLRLAHLEYPYIQNTAQYVRR